jgi:Type II secretion system (T2SS), protein E, N-terminal domain
VSDSITPFPTLLTEEPPAWQWPLPQAARRFVPPPAMGTAQPCRIETQAGAVLAGVLLEFEPSKRRLNFRIAPDGPDVSLPFARLLRVTLTTPVLPVARMAGSPRERVPAALQERDYRLQQVGAATAAALTGRTAGCVDSAEGIFLFAPVDDGGALQRVFVPRSAYSRCEFGASAEELAARHWIASPARLLEAIAQQQHRPVMPLGQSLLELGLVTQTQLDRALASLDGNTALGVSLVNAGLVSRTDMQTALAHKMGFPLVDLQSFPSDAAAVALLPLRVAISHRVMPLLVEQQQLVVAVDRPSRVIKLRLLDAYAKMPIVPVLALKSQILLALNRQSGEGWNLNICERVSFFATTI